MSDHPRIRGEHSDSASTTSDSSGSSPHTRGALDDPLIVDPVSGIIPAYAGSTILAAAAALDAPDHPRIRGEHSPSLSGRSSPPGSSPHTRGAPTTSRYPSRRSGIIPAYAGSTAAHGFASRGRRGSSPHTRGAQRRQPFDVQRSGIIPAYAGSTQAHTRIPHLVQDHPRIRGEHEKARHAPAQTPGSSPHTRGAPLFACAHDRHIGIIPAYAGSTVSPASTRATAKDHPRIRGEHCVRESVPRTVQGSSPHTRGAPSISTCSPPPSPDHPRIRGEHESTMYCSPRDSGSSPHTRGARLRKGSGRGRAGIIPAYAGSTPAPAERPRRRRDHPRIRGEHRPSAVC